jgi:hypothetical protein
MACFSAREGQKLLKQGAKPAPTKLINNRLTTNKSAAPIPQQNKGAMHLGREPHPNESLYGTGEGAATPAEHVIQQSEIGSLC